MEATNNSTWLLAEYDAREHIYKGLLSRCEQLLGELLGLEKLRVLAVTGRVKRKASLSGKLTREGKKYDKLVDVTDIVGLRVITFFEDDVDKVAALVSQQFELIPEHCVDKRATLEPDRFGYRSLHYVCRLHPSRQALAENVAFVDQPLEIQIRSILQHAWAEIEHDLGYKGEITIPNEVKRQLSRVSGLLEIADREFCEVRQKSAAYEARVREEISRNALTGIELDAISYNEFISSSEIVKSLDAFIRSELGYEIRPTQNPESVLRLLRYLNITTVESLKDVLEKHAELLKQYAYVVFAGDVGIEPRVLSSAISLYHLPQIIALERDGVDGLTKMYEEFRIAKIRTGQMPNIRESAEGFCRDLSRARSLNA